MKRKTNRTNKTKDAQIKALGSMCDFFSRAIEQRRLPAVGSPAHRVTTELAMEAGTHTDRPRPRPPVPFWKKIFTRKQK
mgnify:FL=1|tara:strand:- start:762 stop:998 length:237 start_codon:yes stop_codon:yes gene_type:complete